MIRLNLLPYRETRRIARLRQFAVLLGGVAVIGVLVVLLGFTVFDARLQMQNARNEYLKNEIAKLDKQISAIHELKKETQELLARKQVVESLQTDRSDAVHLLDQLVRLMPEGVFLKSIDQHGDVVHLQGYAQSSARVSSLMRNLDSSPWLSNATLIEVKAATIQGIQANEFSMDVHTKSLVATSGSKEPDKNGKAD
jgi:type IV pilus assembly protein PilN